MSLVFLCGGLAEPDLAQAVLGMAVAGREAVLCDYVALLPEGESHVALQAAPGHEVGGILVNLDAAGLERLGFYAEVMGLAAHDITISGQAAVCYAAVDASQDQARVDPWRGRDQLPDYAYPLAVDVMALWGQVAAARVRQRLPQMAVRAASTLRALGQSEPATLRRQAEKGDVKVALSHQPYAHFFAVVEYDLRFRRFNGELSEEINRAVFLSGDAVTVLPYDPKRDRVLLVEQFRAGPFARGAKNPWSLEAIAGRVDADETPEHAARREAVEEAGLTLGALWPVHGYYPSPGAKAEYLYNYIAICDLPDGVAGVFGLAEEAEDIRGHVIARQKLMDLIAAGEITNGPLIVSALCLERDLAKLRPA